MHSKTFLNFHLNHGPQKPSKIPSLKRESKNGSLKAYSTRLIVMDFLMSVMNDSQIYDEVHA